MLNSERLSAAFPLITLPHAIAFIHPRWHTEIDVHTFLPGSYADAAITSKASACIASPASIACASRRQSATMRSSLSS